MEIYFFQLLTLFFIWLCLDSIRIKNRNIIFLIFAFFILSFVEGFRGELIGTDTRNYIDLYNLGRSEGYEILFAVFINLLSALGLNSTWFIFFSSCLINGFTMYAIARSKANPFLCVFLYFTLYYYFFTFNGLRQGIAMGAVLVAFTFALEDRLVGYLIWLMVAIGFHLSALVGVVLFPLHLICAGISRSKVVVLLDKKGVFYYLGMPICILSLLVLLRCIVSFVPFILRSFFPSYAYYLQTSYFTEGGGIREAVVSLCFFFTYFYLTADKGYTKYYNLVVLFLPALLSIMALQIGIFYRIGLYFSMCAQICVSSIFFNNTIRTKRVKILFVYLLMAVCLVYWFYLLSANLYRVRDYYFCF